MENEICKLTGKRCTRIGEDGRKYCGGNNKFKGICSVAIAATQALESQLEGGGRHLKARRVSGTIVHIDHSSDVAGKKGRYIYRSIDQGGLTRQRA